MAAATRGATGNGDVINAHLVANDPCPIVCIDYEERPPHRSLADALEQAAKHLAPSAAYHLLLPGVRCVALDRLDYVLEHGCDVRPTSAPIYADFAEKALEYGDLMLVYNARILHATWREVPSSTPQAELDTLRETYPNILRSTDGQSLWLSRLPLEDRRCASPYEAQFAKWIPGPPFEALVAVFVLAPRAARMADLVKGAIMRTEAVHWRLVSPA